MPLQEEMSTSSSRGGLRLRPEEFNVIGRLHLSYPDAKARQRRKPSLPVFDSCRQLLPPFIPADGGFSSRTKSSFLEADEYGSSRTTHPTNELTTTLRSSESRGRLNHYSRRFREKWLILLKKVYEERYRRIDGRTDRRAMLPIGVVLFTPW